MRKSTTVYVTIAAIILTIAAIGAVRLCTYKTSVNTAPATVQMPVTKAIGIDSSTNRLPEFIWGQIKTDSLHFYKMAIASDPSLVKVIAKGDLRFIKVDSQRGNWLKTGDEFWILKSEIAPYYSNSSVYERIYTDDHQSYASPPQIDSFFGTKAFTLDGSVKIYQDSTLNSNMRIVSAKVVKILNRRKEGVLSTEELYGYPYTIEVFNVKVFDDSTKDTITGWASAIELLPIGTQPSNRELLKGIVGFYYIEYSGAYFPLEFVWLKTHPRCVSLGHCTKIFRSPDKQFYLVYSQASGSLLIDSLGNTIIQSPEELCSPIWCGNYVYTRSICDNDNVYRINISQRKVDQFITCPDRFGSMKPEEGYYEWPEVEISSLDSTLTAYFYRSNGDNYDEITVKATKTGKIIAMHQKTIELMPFFSGSPTIYEGSILWD